MRHHSVRSTPSQPSPGSSGNSHADVEWIPSMLQKPRAFPMAAICFLLVAGLEYLYRTVENNHGIRSEQKTLVIALRYLPTTAAICLGISWKSIVGDLKKIMPWSVLSGEGWARPSESLFLNYVNKIEIVSVFTAARKKHWAMLLGLLVGFLCGAAIAATNSLTFMDLFAEEWEEATFQRTSAFNLNGTLVTPDGNLTIPLHHLGNRPYGAVAVERLPGGHSAPWSNNNFAFDSLKPTVRKHVATNSSIQALVKAFSADMECYPLRVTSEKTDGNPYLLHANEQDLARAGCSFPLSWKVKSCYRHSQAWLNVTACSDTPNDARLFAFISVPVAFNSSGTCSDTDGSNTGSATHLDGGEISVLSTVALLCTPKFSIRDVVVRANGSTEEIIDYEPTSPAVAVNPYRSIEAILLYLINPTDSQSHSIYGPMATSDSVKSILIRVMRFWGVDPFFSALNVGRNALSDKKYVDDPNLFQSEVSALAGATLAQVVSAFARRNDSQWINGTITSTSSRLFIEEFSLRMLQGILLTVGLAFILQATILRPRTNLRESPGPIAATALVLAASKIQVEHAILEQSVSSDETARQALSRTRWNFRQTHHNAWLDVSTEDEAEDSAVRPTNDKHHGWRPLVFRAYAKAGVITIFLAVVTTLAVLQQQSEAHNGLCRESKTALTFSQYIASGIIVLLGYICSGIDSSVRSATSYYSLKKHPSNKRPLLFDIKDRPTFRLLWNAESSLFVLTISSFIILLFPVVKIVTAGLYQASLATSNKAFEFRIDQSLATNLEQTYRAFEEDNTFVYTQGEATSRSDTTVERASQFAEWSKTPGLCDARRDGILENLILANITGWPTELDQVSAVGDEIHVNVPAIAVDVQCDMLSPDDFRLVSDGSTGAEFGCSTSRCANVYQSSGPGGDTFIRGSFWSHGKSHWGYNPNLKYQGDAWLPQTYVITLADFSPWSKPVINNTLIEKGTTILSDMLNASLPTARAISCFTNLSLVNVDATYTQSTKYGINGTTAKRPWHPSRFDKKSILYQRKYGNIPEWFYPPRPMEYGDPDRNKPGKLNSDTLWPSQGSSANVFQLLAVYAEYQTHNLTSLLNPEDLREAAKQMITAFQTELVTELRTYIVNNTTQNSTETRHGTLSMARTRIKQNLRTTIILETLLAAVFFCLLWILFRFSVAAMLPKEPDSIAARLCLMADSQLVQRLRTQNSGPSTSSGSEICTEKAELGWWRVQNAGTTEWRWGIDISDGVVRRNWDDPPQPVEAAP